MRLSGDQPKSDPAPLARARQTMPATLVAISMSVGMGTDEGPRSLAAAAGYNWKFSGDKSHRLYGNRDIRCSDGLTGVIFQRSEIKMAQVTDGTTYTYLLGEKCVDAAEYETGRAGNDDQSMYNGHDKDNLRGSLVWYPGFENEGRSTLSRPSQIRLASRMRGISGVRIQAVGPPFSAITPSDSYRSISIRMSTRTSAAARMDA